VFGSNVRGPGNLNKDRNLSAIHASVTRAGNTLTIEDLKSTDGTWVNGKRLRKPAQVHAGDEIQIGSSLLRVEVTEPFRLESDAGSAALSAR
jgi:pSer/pThr/pTyr-binding forkhead associated (FHA) protein